MDGRDTARIAGVCLAAIYLTCMLLAAVSMASPIAN
jgi:hypothetical protein